MMTDMHRALFSTLIKVDLDGVLRNWNASLIREFEKMHSDVKVTYPFKDFNIAPSFPAWVDNKKFYLYEKSYDIYRYAEPYAGAVEFMRTLADLYPNVWLVTTQYENTMFPTIQWIEQWLPARNIPVGFSHEKGLIGRDKFEHTILIDDAPHNLTSEAMNGGMAYCFGQLYNFNHVDTPHWRRLIYGSLDFSVEAEAQRISRQFDMILEMLSMEFQTMRFA